MRTPFELGCRPSPASITPALTSSSLYLPIASSRPVDGILPASLSADAFTMIMNRMAVSLLRGFGAGRRRFRRFDRVVGTHVADMRGQRPVVAERVAQHAIAVAPEHVLRFHHGLAARLDRAPER